MPIFSNELEANQTKPCAAPTATQDHVQIGHNGGPDFLVQRLFDLIGAKPPEAITPFKKGTPWTGHAKDSELKRLGKLQARIERREKALRDLKSERTTIMNRCIRRMRRSNGLN
ncbi:MAG: hypothetical protein ABJO27_19280 [Pseudoruegeria sp.]